MAQSINRCAISAIKKPNCELPERVARVFSVESRIGRYRLSDVLRTSVIRDDREEARPPDRGPRYFQRYFQRGPRYREIRSPWDRRLV